MKKILLLVAGFGLIFVFLWLLLYFLFLGHIYEVWILPLARLV